MLDFGEMVALDRMPCVLILNCGIDKIYTWCMTLVIIKIR